MHVLLDVYKMDIKDMLFVAPDAGATKKIHSLVSAVCEEYGDVGYVQAEKIRDLKTSNIIRTKINAQQDEISGRTCVIADDICDGGRTFVELGNALKNMGASKVVLLVTHGILSKNLDVFIDSVDIVICSNSLPGIDPNTNNVKYDRMEIFIDI
jgi:ribose-phosphate pyrophosphokinase